MKKTLLATALLAAVATASAAPRVVSSIYPLQQIANAIVGEPTGLIADSYQSPHDYSITPKDAQKINDADIVLWVNAGLIPQLDKYLERRSADKTTLTALDLPNMKLLKSSHDHDHDHHHDDHAEDKHDKHDDHHNDHAEDKHDEHHHDHTKDKHDKHNDHDEADFGYDHHVWLSTHNAEVIAKALAAELSRQDKGNATVYEENLQTFLADLQQTKADIIGNFESNPPADYFVFHDAYAYFEDEFGVEHKDVITLYGGQAPKAGVLTELRGKLNAAKNGCLFREPQFDSKIVKRLAEGTNVSVAELDPVGYTKDKNIGYTTIIRNIGNQIASCGQTK